MKLAITEIVNQYGSGFKSLKELVELGCALAEHRPTTLGGNTKEGIFYQADMLHKNPLFIKIAETELRRLDAGYSHTIDLIPPPLPLCFSWSPKFRYYVTPTDDVTITVCLEFSNSDSWEIGKLLTIKKTQNGLLIDPVKGVTDEAAQHHQRTITLFLDALDRGIITLEKENRPTFVKKGCLNIPKCTARRAKHGARGRLVATHLRNAYYRVLRAPRYYPDGIVPTDKALLRRVPVKETVVKRDIDQRVAVKTNGV
jgi:hypothetical protein